MRVLMLDRFLKNKSLLLINAAGLLFLTACSLFDEKNASPTGRTNSSARESQPTLRADQAGSSGPVDHMLLSTKVRNECKAGRDARKSKLTFAEQPKLQWDWNTDNAGRSEIIPDFVARAFKDDKQTCLLIPHSELGMLCGRDIHSLSGTSIATYKSPHNPVWPAYDYKNWVASPFHLGNGKLFALAHSEWYECLNFKDDPPKKCSVGQNQFNSWSNALSSYSSSDSAKSWNRVATLQRPAQLPPAFTALWPKALMNHGFFHPGNIITEDGYYYAFVKYVSRNANTGDVESSGLILMRTKNLFSAQWEQVGAQGKVVSDSSVGHPLPKTESWDLPTVTFNRSLCKYLLTFWDYATQTSRYVTFESLARPAFSDAQDIANQNFLAIPGNERPTGFVAANYPTGQIDPDSLGDNFQFTDDDFLMFLGSFHSSNVLKRSLYRTSLKFVDVEFPVVTSTSRAPDSKSPNTAEETLPTETPQQANTPNGQATGANVNSTSLRSVFRFNNGYEHYFSITPTSARAGFVLEGEAFKLKSQSADGLVPLKRCVRRDTNHALLSAKPDCEGFSQDEVLGFMSIENSPGTQALYRCYNKQTMRHISTIYSSECAAAVYLLEGIQGYVYP